MATADPKIAAARSEMFDRRDRVRNTMAKTETRGTGKFLSLTGKPEVQYFSNRPAINRLCDAIMTACLRFDALQSENPKNIDGAIARVLTDVDAAWAAIDEMTALGEPGSGIWD